MLLLGLNDSKNTIAHNNDSLNLGITVSSYFFLATDIPTSPQQKIFISAVFRCPATILWVKSFSGKGVGSVYLHFCDYSGTSARERGLVAKENWKPMDPRNFGYDVRVRPNADRPYRLWG